MLRHKRKKGPVRAKKTLVDGISFASGLEAYMYKALKEANITANYEGEKYELIQSFEFKNDVYERCANSKGEYKNRGDKNILGIKYTPDFVGDNFIIECKGRPNESFPIRWKLFKRYVQVNLPEFTIYKPQNQTECDITINLILQTKKQ
jgi:hypothetical protein